MATFGCAAEERRVDSRVDVHVTPGASAKLLAELFELVVVQRTGSDHLRCRFAAMLGRKAAKSANDGAKLALAAIPCKNAEKVGRDGVEAELRRQRRERLASFFTRNDRARDQLVEVL